MTGLTEYILGVSGAVLLAVWLALLAAAVFSRPTPNPGRPGWLAARCQTGAPTGLARDDPRVLASVIGHRAPWLTSLAKVLTWLGSNLVLWPVVVAAGLGL